MLSHLLEPGFITKVDGVSVLSLYSLSETSKEFSLSVEEYNNIKASGEGFVTAPPNSIANQVFMKYLGWR